MLKHIITCDENRIRLNFKDKRNSSNSGNKGKGDI